MLIIDQEVQHNFVNVSVIYLNSLLKRLWENNMGKCCYCNKAIKGTSSAYLMSQRSANMLIHEKNCVMNPNIGKRKYDEDIRLGT